jgi:hypothetical protein
MRHVGNPSHLFTPIVHQIHPYEATTVGGIAGEMAVFLGFFNPLGDQTLRA